MIPLRSVTAPPRDRAVQLAWGLGLWCALLLAWFCYRPGLTGPFIFDDFWNLKDLSEVSRSQDALAPLRYALGGIASSLGRPLSLLSFALQHDDWPSDPGAFIRVNVLLHLLNGCLLFWMLLRLQRVTVLPVPALPVAAIAAAAWLFAPLHASAVLYVVQRMAVLSGTFMLLGLVVYLAGRERAGRAGLWLSTVGLGIGLGLGVLAKENAALFPLLILVIEHTLPRSPSRPALPRAWSAVCLLAPLGLLAAYVAYALTRELADAPVRAFTSWERLLTESRVLWLYVGKLVLPSLYSVRLLYDDIAVSRSLLDPVSTLPAALAWIALAAASVRLRRRAAVAAFGVLWFLANHLLESTVLPLELAFEHRNYVASIGPVFSLTVLGARVLARFPRLRVPLAASFAAYAAFGAIALHQSAELWGRPLEQAAWWSRAQPDSPRARHMLADALTAHGDARGAARVYEEARARWPDDPSFVLGVWQAGCLDGSLPLPPVAALAAAARSWRGPPLTALNMLHHIFEVREAGACMRYSPGDLYDLVEALAEGAAFDPQRQNLMLLRSRAAEIAGERSNARVFLDEAIAVKPRGSLLIQAGWWALAAGDLRAARTYVDRGESLGRVDRLVNGVELRNLRRRVEEFEGAARPGGLGHTPADRAP